MASPTQWTCVWVNSGSWWWTGRPGMLQFMGSQRIGHNWVTELNWLCLNSCFPRLQGKLNYFLEKDWILSSFWFLASWDWSSGLCGLCIGWDFADFLFVVCLFFVGYFIHLYSFMVCCGCSVAQSRPALCDPMDCSTPVLPVLHHLPELAQNSCPSSQWCHPTISSSVVPFSSCPQSFPASGSFPRTRLFTSGGQSIGASASASIVPMTIQGRFPLGLTSLISLLVKGLSRVFSSPTVQKHQFFGAQPSLWFNSHIHTWLLETP